MDTIEEREEKAPATYDELFNLVEIYESEIIELKDELQKSSVQNSQLTGMLGNAKALIRQMELELLNTQEDACLQKEKNLLDNSDAQKKKREFSKEVLDRWEFYNKHKNDPDILEPLREQFRTVGLNCIPWHLVKKRTDDLFFHLHGGLS